MNQNIWKLKGPSIHRQRRRAQATAFYLVITPEDFILDVGCGEGFVTSHFLKAGYVVGVDTSINSLLIAKQKVNELNVEFVCANAGNLPFRNSVFNKVTMLEVLEHLPKETQKKTCQEVDRILKKEGILVISVPYKEQITYTRCIHCGKLTPLWGHLHSMDEEKVTNLLPKPFALMDHCHLPNVGLISLAGIFEHLPLRLWLLLNDLFGKFRKGYWLLLKYEKR